MTTTTTEPTYLVVDALLKGKRSEVLQALANHLDERNDDAGLELLLELLELSNIQFQIITDLVVPLCHEKLLQPMS